MIVTFEFPSTVKNGGAINPIAGIRPCITHVVDGLIIFGVPADVQDEIGRMGPLNRNRLFMEEADQP
jgi:hypothetical protein